MVRFDTAVLACTVSLVAAGAATAQYTSEELLAVERGAAVLAAKFPSCAPFQWDENDDERAWVYGDAKGVVHLKVTDGQRSREVWRSFTLQGSILDVLAEDLDRDGRSEIVAVTSGPRVYVWETREFELLWESVQEKFESIQAVAVADTDRDEALEIVLVADSKIVVIDGAELFREREGRDFVDPSAIVIGDVDGDLAPEIVTNDGYVVDAQTLNIEWATDGFGYPIHLFDVDSDGVLDLIGESDAGLTIWNVGEKREIW